MKKSFWIRKVAGFILLFFLAVLFFTYIVMTLWNNILADVIGVHMINFGQALGILVLSKILFSGFRGGGGGWRGRGRYWNNEMSSKWQKMTPEERENFKKEWRSRCFRGHSPPAGNTSATADNAASDQT